ncbi:hypothetical protein RHAL1_01030 [Beijerinckiaceae bacterium RH AL1]|nr:phage portal protein [Beijerinckiaceae bacterium]VVB44033.1 hypothetical protein RHCH11_RHCH11_01005 [Beijerinckiaceae bacterium RH CH11]VVB44060.1 hypothetical protein RHAL8_01002 [Beijerinckiaceae bacterium RH AL8]VVC54137.1 hypothetical protein RHAL1_01030 [Beijerinckiaceae bacterium RH AL1]
MVDRTTGRASYALDPYQVSLSFAARQAAGGEDWFGPLSPIAPTAPANVAGRQWDYPAGYNLALEPRPYSPVSFATLRQLADGWDLLRLVIETRKDQIARLAWSIKPRAGGGKPDARCAAITAFFARPDGIHGWADWLRLLLEELLVIDAPALYYRRTRGGRLAALLPIDGATIKPVIDAWGRTPQPGTADGKVVWPTAYQQVLKGFPAVDYTTRDLVYRPRNVRVNRAYGYSPVEQVVTTVNIALRRQLFLLEYFTEGNIPDSLIGVPEGWTPDQIASYQKYWDAYFSGESGRRRRAKFVPGAAAQSFVQTKEPELKSAFDDWLARLVCFAFSISPQALVSQMNRATAEVQKTLAEEEGLAPLLAWVKALIDDVIAAELDGADLEFAWTPTETIDPAQQETILSSYTSRGILTLNEARAALGREPLADRAADTPMALTGAGYVGLTANATATKPAR